MIYFIQSNEYVKIGYTSNLRNRYKKYVTENPEPIKLIGKCNGGFDVEKKIHRELSDWHYRGEWFHLTEASRMRIYEIIRENRDNEEPEKSKVQKERGVLPHIRTLQSVREYATASGYIDLTIEIKKKIAAEHGVVLNTVERHIAKLVQLKKLGREAGLYHIL